MRANLLFCCIVLIALVFEYRAYVNREQETDQNLEVSIKNLLIYFLIIDLKRFLSRFKQKIELLETVRRYREEIHHIQDEAVHGHTHD